MSPIIAASKTWPIRQVVAAPRVNTLGFQLLVKLRYVTAAATGGRQEIEGG